MLGFELIVCSLKFQTEGEGGIKGEAGKFRPN